jgi:hypothetical protein
MKSYRPITPVHFICNTTTGQANRRLLSFKASYRRMGKGFAASVLLCIVFIANLPNRSEPDTGKDEHSLSSAIKQVAINPHTLASHDTICPTHLCASSSIEWVRAHIVPPSTLPYNLNKTSAMHDYSQIGQAGILMRKYFRGKRNGRFLEVHAA